MKNCHLRHSLLVIGILLLSTTSVFPADSTQLQINSSNNHIKELLSLEQAFNDLLTTNEFSDGFLGESDDHPMTLFALRRVWLSPDADSLFMKLLDSATIAGQLYALCGIYFTDNESFQDLVKLYIDRKEFVTTISGCIVMDETICDVVGSKYTPVIRLKYPGQKLNEWITINKELIKDGYYFDIIGGGYPAQFRELDLYWREIIQKD